MLLCKRLTCMMKNLLFYDFWEFVIAFVHANPWMSMHSLVKIHHTCIHWSKYTTRQTDKNKGQERERERDFWKFKDLIKNLTCAALDWTGLETFSSKNGLESRLRPTPTFSKSDSMLLCWVVMNLQNKRLKLPKKNINWIGCFLLTRNFEYSGNRIPTKYQTCQVFEWSK